MLHHHVTGPLIIVLNQLLNCSISKSDQCLIFPYKINYIFKQKVMRTKKVINYGQKLITPFGLYASAMGYCLDVDANFLRDTCKG